MSSRSTAASLFEFNAAHFAAENLDAAHRGLGTQSCGPDALNQYKLNANRYTFSYTLTTS